MSADVVTEGLLPAAALQHPPHRASGTGGIELRAVSASFLKEFTRGRILADASLGKRCTKAAITYLKGQIESLETERDAIGVPSSGSLKESTLARDAQLMQLSRRIDQLNFDLTERKTKAYLTTRDVHREVVKAEVDSQLCRYVEQPHWLNTLDEHGTPFVAKADFFVSHSWDSPWQSVVDACVEHSDALPAGARKPYYWIDIFAVNQHTPHSQYCACDDTCTGCKHVLEDLPDWNLMQRSHDVGFERVIRTARKTLLVMEPWNAPRPPTRVWCLYESYVTLQQPGGELVVALGREQRRSMQMSLQRKFEALEQMIGRLDARRADVTVESDRENIFGAIEQLEGGFDGLNNSLRSSLRVWLAENADQLLERMDPDRPRMTPSELQAEKNEHGACAMRVTQVVDWWPGLIELLMLVSVAIGAFSLAVFPAIVSERLDWPDEIVLFLMAVAFFFLMFAATLLFHQDKHQLRRGALLRGGKRRWLRCLICTSACSANYLFPASIIAGIFFFGVFGFSVAGGSSILVWGLIVIGVSDPADVCTRYELMNRTGMLYLQCGMFNKALSLFEASVPVLESTLGVGDYKAVASNVGKVMALHKCGRVDEGHQLAQKCISQVDVALRCPRYMLEQVCLGGWGCNWFELALDPLGSIRRCDWLYLRAAFLAADSQDDSEVLGNLEAAVSGGLLPNRDGKTFELNVVGDTMPPRFVHSSFAFAAITERADVESSRTGAASDLIHLEEQMHANFKKRWRRKTVHRVIGCSCSFGLIVTCFLLVIRARKLHYLTGTQCTSIEGTYLGVSGCHIGMYCDLGNDCESCPTVAPGTTLALEECYAIDGERGCCTDAFVQNCPQSPFDCSR